MLTIIFQPFRPQVGASKRLCGILRLARSGGGRHLNYSWLAGNMAQMP
jgi:hypothetical protein